MSDWALGSLYPKAYGEWAGNPEGMKPDPERCCIEVYGFAGRFSQCARARGHGPEQAYCKQHDPENVAARQKASAERERQRWLKDRLQLSGPTLYRALCKIADGDNDPRQTAIDAIAHLRSKP